MRIRICEGGKATENYLLKRKFQSRNVKRSVTIIWIQTMWSMAGIPSSRAHQLITFTFNMFGFPCVINQKKRKNRFYLFSSRIPFHASANFFLKSYVQKKFKNFFLQIISENRKKVSHTHKLMVCWPGISVAIFNISSQYLYLNQSIFKQTDRRWLAKWAKSVLPSKMLYDDYICFMFHLVIRAEVHDHITSVFFNHQFYDIQLRMPILLATTWK